MCLWNEYLNISGTKFVKMFINIKFRPILMKFILINCDFEPNELANEKSLFTNFFKNYNVDLENYDVYLEKFPTQSSLQNADGVIIGGSNASVYEDSNYPWIQKVEDIIQSLYAMNKPTLGICFGSQLLAQSLGGEVKKSRSLEAGFNEVELTTDGQADVLLKNMPKKFIACCWHSDQITKIPNGAKNLAQNSHSLQIFKFSNMYAVQFHPEINHITAQIVALAEGTDRSIFEVSDYEYRNQEIILLNFIDFCKSTQNKL
jgi:GMP synthase-like glutamine amidotransferase